GVRLVGGRVDRQVGAFPGHVAPHHPCRTAHGDAVVGDAAGDDAAHADDAAVADARPAEAAHAVRQPDVRADDGVLGGAGPQAGVDVEDGVGVVGAQDRKSVV